MEKIKKNVLLYFYLLVLVFFIGWIIIGNINNYGSGPLMLFVITLLGILFELALRIKKVTFIAKILRWIVIGASVIMLVLLIVGMELFKSSYFSASYIDVATLYVLVVFILSTLLTKIGKGRGFTVQVIKIASYAVCFVVAAFTHNSIAPIIITAVALVIVYFFFLGFANKFSGTSSSTVSSSSQSTSEGYANTRCEGCRNYEEYLSDGDTCRRCNHYKTYMNGRVPDYSSESAYGKHFYECYYGNRKCDSFVPKK